MRSDVPIESARPEDLPRILRLLERCGLPREGLEAHLPTVLVARLGDRVLGCAGLEIYGACALLRSVAVDPSRRGGGLGERLANSALGLARERGVRTVYLLTETASGFFPRFGFRLVDRKEVAEEVRSSVEFRSACPASALAMEARLKPSTAGDLHRRLSGFVRKRIRNPQDADDVTQTVFAKIQENLHALSDAGRHDAWAYRIARRTITDYYRLRKRMDAPLPQEPAGAEEPDLQQEVAGWMEGFIRELPEASRQALVLADLQGVSQRELARRLGLSLSGAKSRVQRARALLKDALLRCCSLHFDRRGRIIDYSRRGAVRAKARTACKPGGCG